MKITFYGAARAVTGSQHLIEVNGTRILLDCGLYQGRRAEAEARNRNLPFDAKSVDLMILSHAHIDHSGNIPNLVRSGFRGDIITTSATRDLCASMLIDSAHIQEQDAVFLNKKRAKGEQRVEPIYTQQDAITSLDYFTTQSYERARKIAPGVTLTLKDAGHMLGSAIVILDIEDQEEKRSYRLVFSGDLGRKGIPIIRDPETIDSTDYLIMESTYGDRTHPPYEDDTKRMEQIIVETYKRGGSVVVPAFAVGRTQQLVYTLHQLRQKNDIPALPIYVDSPLAIDVTAVFRLHPECYDDEIRAFMENADHRVDPFGFDDLIYTRSVEESKQINFLRDPAIIISASGMAETGRILHHLRNRIEDPRTTVLLVGYQAENTLGRRLQEGAKEVRIFGQMYPNRAHVEMLSGFSGHADRDGLIAWVGAMQRKPQRTFLVHGEGEAQPALAQALNERFGMQVDVPEFKQTITVG
ncbi:MAG TPA: MBL fold metallo-hydrolase [Phototrophicaceae bacterium]|nr:MBL fold metallo-hydrolase [Phototrophicaceae bacterium]